MEGDGVELVVGMDGMIGAALVRWLRAAGHRVLGASRRPDAPDGALYLDLAEPPKTWHGPPVATAYICAAVTRLDACRRDPAGSARVNIDGAVGLARLLAGQGAFVVYLSTNHVFDGTRPYRRPEEATCPLNEYGRQKAMAEEQLLKLGSSAAVLRLTKVLGDRVALFDGWTTGLRSRKGVCPYLDMTMAPLPVPTVIDVIARLGQQRRAGVHHLSASRDVSYVEIARMAAKLVGADELLVEPVATLTANPSAEAPPRYTTLDDLGFPQSLGVPVPGIDVTIRTALLRGIGVANSAA